MLAPEPRDTMALPAVQEEQMPLRVVPVVRVTNTNLVRGGQMPLGGCCRVVRSRARSTRLCASCRHRRRCGWYRRSHVALHTRSVQCVRGSVCLQSSPLVMVAGQLLSSVSVWMDRKNLFSVQLLFAASHAMFCGYCGHLGPRPLARPLSGPLPLLTSHRPPLWKPEP